MPMRAWHWSLAALAELATIIHAAALLVLALYGAHRIWLTVGALSSISSRSCRSTWFGGRRRRGAPVPPLPAELPFVTVQLPLYNEPAVAARLIDAVAALDWPADRLEIQVLDDSTDETSPLCAARVQAAAARGLSIVHLQRRDRTGYKAGALDAGRLVARGELIAVLDSDFLVPPSFLRDTVPHFADPSVAMVQARWEHLNRTASLLTRVQALLLDGHFAIEQRARAHRQHIFNFNGTAGVWRATAIAEAGGWHADTLTEDLDLSYRAALLPAGSAGAWRFVYLDRVAVPAELPESMSAFRSQQFRWAKGSIEVALKLAGTTVRCARRPSARLEGLLHLTHNVPYLATAVLVVSGVVASGLGASPWLGSITWITAAITALVLGGYVLVAQWSLGRPRWLASLFLIPAMTALVAGISIGQARGIAQALRHRRSEFVRTPKTGSAPAAPLASPVTAGVALARRAPRRPAAAYLPEALLGLAALASAVLTAQHGAWSSALPLLLFALGLGWVALGSLRE
jgi:cellulose synthase/poly-beta-1,6-N-acetylglucosamine synthase-like glycosyltransferase